MQWFSVRPRESGDQILRHDDWIPAYAGMSREGQFGKCRAGGTANSRRGVGGGDRFDDEAIFASARVRRPPTVPLFVAAVVAPQPRRIELRHRHRVFAKLEQRLQRAACVDLAVVVEREPNDLKHARDPRVELVGVCGTPRPLREFDKARERSAAAITRSTQGAAVHARVIEPSYRRRYLTIVNKNGVWPELSLDGDERARKIFSAARDRRDSRAPSAAGDAQRPRSYSLALVPAGACQRRHGRRSARARSKLRAKLRLPIRLSRQRP